MSERQHGDHTWVTSGADGAYARGPAMVFVIVYCLLLLCVPSQLIVGPLGAPGSPANLWGLLALGWWTFASLGGLNPAHSWSPVRIAALVMAVGILASYAAGMTRGWSVPTGMKQATDDVLNMVPVDATMLSERTITAADRGLLSLGGWLGIVLLTTDGFRGWTDIERLVKWLAWIAAAIATIGILQFFTGLNIATYFHIPGLVANADFGAVSSRSVVRRVSSTAVHPIEFGVVLAGIFPLALHVAISHWPRKAMMIPAVLIGCAIPMSVSRSAILALLVALVILLIGWPNAWRIRALIIAPISAVIFRLMIPGLLGTILSLFTNISDDPSVEGRTEDYSPVFQLASHSLAFGRGLFTFLPQYYRILDNQFLLLLVEVGIFGSSCVVLLFVVAYLSARSARRSAPEPSRKNLALSISAGLAGVVVSYFTFDAWGFPMAAGLTFLLIGMSGAVWQAARAEKAGDGHSGGRVKSWSATGVAS